MAYRLPTEAELRIQADVMRGLNTDSRNRRRRQRYRELHRRACVGCELVDLTGRYNRRCPQCQARHELELRYAARQRACLDCPEDVTGTRKRRCLRCWLINGDNVREARNARRRRTR